MGDVPIPVRAACRLEDGEVGSRVAEFRRVLAPRVRAASRSAGAVVLDLELDAAQGDALAELLARERECCPFWRFSLTTAGDGRARLEVRTAPGAEEALEAVTALAGLPAG